MRKPKVTINYKNGETESVTVKNIQFYEGMFTFELPEKIQRSDYHKPVCGFDIRFSKIKRIEIE